MNYCYGEYGEYKYVILVAAPNTFRASEIMKSRNSAYDDLDIEMIQGAEYTGREGVIFEK